MLLIGALIVVGGCSNNKAIDNYENMKVSIDEVDGYTLNLKISGTIGADKIDEIVKIDNYDESDYRIMALNTAVKDDDSQADNEVTYIIDGKVYTKNSNGTYISKKDGTMYNNPSVYIDGLKEVYKTSKVTKATIDDITYEVYDVIFSENVINNIIEDSVISDIKADEEVTGKIYINDKKHAYRIIYYINDITITANYLGIEASRNVNPSAVD